MPIVDIDPYSGCCFGVVKAIGKAEDCLDREGQLYCLGDIVHNTIEVERLKSKGLVTISHEALNSLHDTRLLLRAHGEPPSTYRLAEERRIRLIDATCPVVLHLQQRIRRTYEEHRDDATQLLIFGKAGHAEVNGLVGQTDNTALVVEDDFNLDNVRMDRPIVLFSQTTMSQKRYDQLVELISSRLEEGVSFEHHDTICRHFSHRMPRSREFALVHDCIVFVSDHKSSNGKSLFRSCQEANPDTWFVSRPEEIQAEWVRGKERIGICGATSTPEWLMEEARKRIYELVSE